jgi:hypothetical protein
MTTFDFQDGNGPVPAHQHPNGGGWVADTARVAGTAYVGPDAQVYGRARVSGTTQVSGNALVFGNARVFGYAEVYNNAQVFGTAHVFGSARVSGYAQVFGNARVKRGKYATTPLSITRSDGYTFTLQSDGSIIAGCHDFTSKEADAHWGDLNHHMHQESWAIVQALRAISLARD